MIGLRIGNLTVIKKVPTVKNGRTRATWECLCDCGNTRMIEQYALRKNNPTRSCGCLTKKAATTHGMSYTTEYRIWRGMISRCRNKSNKDYGGRGITVCKRWEFSFENFIADMGPRPKELEIDRKDNDGGYEPGNCRWATPTENMRNRRSNRMIEYGGEIKTLSEWAEIHNLSIELLSQRLKAWGDIERALKWPAKKNRYVWVVNGERFCSVRDAAAKTGINDTKLWRRAQTGDENCYMVEATIHDSQT